MNNGEDGLQGQGITDIMVTYCKSWAMDCEESCNTWFKTDNKESEFSVTPVLNTGFPERIPNKKDDYARLPRLLCALVKFNLATTDQSKQICHPYDPIDLCTKSLCPFPLQFM
ncbi:unnamed protein product [Porites evermanni]|uniref:Uncharacterized protein n=1 Tax=Porites evermanni TaxID=104178 RepID=A0ABN8SZ58_9CNID|nr:unnamed protein product [Porites evermanni]